MYVKAKDAAKYYNISTGQLRKWARTGKIPYKETPGGRYQYEINVEPLPKDKPSPIEKDQVTSEYVIYARVSSKKQELDLVRQYEFLQSKFPNYTIVTDIGSGINYERKGFKNILEQVFQGNIKRVVVTYQDRWSRFGFNFFEWLFQKFGAVLQSSNIPEPGTEQDITEDLMEIITVFSARYYGRRNNKVNNKKDKDISNPSTKNTI